MSESYDFGVIAENKARKLLEYLGHKVVLWNYRDGKAEVDIISYIGNYIVFTEVKARKSDEKINDFSPKKAVNTKKKRLLVQAANTYCEKYKVNNEVRFDIVELLLQNKQWKYNHIIDAFKAHEV